MSCRSLILVSLSVVSLTGCASLSGDWTGDMDCGAGASFDVALNVEKDDGAWVGDGDMDLGSEGSVAFSVEIEKEQRWGEQELEIDFDDCDLTRDGQTYDLSCLDLDADWDGADLIEAEVPNFLGSAIQCDLELER